MLADNRPAIVSRDGLLKLRRGPAAAGAEVFTARRGGGGREEKLRPNKNDNFCSRVRERVS